MPSCESNVIRPDFSASRRTDSRPAASDLHSLLDALAKMDLEYEEKRSMIASSHCDSEFKGKILQKFRERHRARREPYLAQLVVLQGCIQEDRPSA